MAEPEQRTDEQEVAESSTVTPETNTEATTTEAAATTESSEAQLEAKPKNERDDKAPEASAGKDKSEAEGPKSLAEAIAEGLKAGDAADKKNDPSAAKPPEAKAKDDKAPEGEKKSAVDPKAKDKSTPKAEAEGGEAELSDDPTDEEMAGYKAHTQKRIKKLVQQRNEARQQYAASEKDAGSYRQLRDFMAQNNLADQEAAQLFQFGAHLKAGNLDEAFKIAEPFMRVMLEGTGRVLPADLRGGVERGEITEQHARELAQSRTRAALANQQRVFAETRLANDQTAARTREHATRVQSAVEQAEQQLRATDPDFDLKADAMREFARAMVAERGLPKNEAEAVEALKAVHTKATKFLSAARPAPKPTRNAPSSGQTLTRGQASTAPKSLAEAVLQGLERGAASRE